MQEPTENPIVVKEVPKKKATIRIPRRMYLLKSKDSVSDIERVLTQATFARDGDYKDTLSIFYKQKEGSDKLYDTGSNLVALSEEEAKRVSPYYEIYPFTTRELHQFQTQSIFFKIPLDMPVKLVNERVRGIINKATRCSLIVPEDYEVIVKLDDRYTDDSHRGYAYINFRETKDKIEGVSFEVRTAIKAILNHKFICEGFRIRASWNKDMEAIREARKKERELKMKEIEDKEMETVQVETPKKVKSERDLKRQSAKQEKRRQKKSVEDKKKEGEAVSSLTSELQTKLGGTVTILKKPKEVAPLVPTGMFVKDDTFKNSRKVVKGTSFASVTK